MEIEITWEDIIRGLPHIGVPAIQDEQMPPHANENANRGGSNAFEGYSQGYSGYLTAIGSRFKVLVSSTKTSAVSVIDTASKLKRGNRWLIRIDNPDRFTPFNHINMNSKMTGFKDPHIALPQGSIQLSKGVANGLNAANKVLTPVAIAIDTYRTGEAAYTDYKNGTSRNTIETASSVAGAWGGGYGGAVGGAALGSAILPGFGTIIGGIIGGVSGGIGGASLVRKGVSHIGDSFEYDMIEKTCLNCGVKFKARQYLNECICIYCQIDNFVLFIFIL